MVAIAWSTILELLPSILNTPDLPCFQTFRYINNCELHPRQPCELELEMQDDHASCRKHLRPAVLEAVMDAAGLVELLEAYETLKEVKPDKAAFPTIKNYFHSLAHRIDTIEDLNERVTNAVTEGLHTVDEITQDYSGRNPILKAIESYNARKQYNELADKNLQIMLQLCSS